MTPELQDLITSRGLEHRTTNGWHIMIIDDGEILVDVWETKKFRWRLRPKNGCARRGTTTEGKSLETLARFLDQKFCDPDRVERQMVQQTQAAQGEIRYKSTGGTRRPVREPRRTVGKDYDPSQEDGTVPWD